MNDIRYDTEMPGDGEEYNILANSLKHVKNHGLFLEIGTRLGGSTKIIIDHLKHIGRPSDLVCIDPYGDLPYEDRDNTWIYADYSNEMKQGALRKLAEYTFRSSINLHMFALEDKEYFARFHDGLPVYRDGVKTKEVNYAFVYFDGPHSTQVVWNEVLFFMDRTEPGAVFVFDDIEKYNHNLIDDYLIKNYFKVLESGKFKKSYIRL